MMPTISGVYLSPRLEMSLSVPSFLAQYNMIAIGRMDAKIRETNSKTMNSDKSNPFGQNDNVKQIITNKGIVMIGGLVKVDTVSAIFNFPIWLFIQLLN